MHPEERGQKGITHIQRADPGFARNPDYRGQGLHLAFTAEDKNAFTTPWSAAITYQRPLGDWSEMVCAETLYDRFTGKAAALPHADKPDFQRLIFVASFNGRRCAGRGRRALAPLKQANVS